MKKLLICYMPAILAVLCMTSCQKEKMSGDGCFRARVENIHTKDAKVSFDMTNGFVWQSGDQIKVCRNQTASSNSDVYMGTYTISEPLVNNQHATFAYSTGTDVTNNGVGNFVAYYPANIRNANASSSNNNSILVPTVQNLSADGSMQDIPMYAESATLNLNFKNLCGILRLHLTSNTGDLVSTIKITTNGKRITGTFTKQQNTEGYSFITTENSTTKNTITICCPTPQDIGGTGKDFCIYLPTGDYPNMEIRIWTNDDHYCKKVFHGGNDSVPANINIARSCYTSVTLSNLSFETMGRGPFTINSNGDKVLFSTGNLQYDISNSRYQFAANDYDYIGATNFTNNTNVIDLFGWGTGNNPTLNSPTESEYPLVFTEWGTTDIHNVSVTWRTLTRDEWVYLLNTRSASTVSSISNSRYAKARVNNIQGLIIFPDDYVHPNGVTPPTGINSTDNTGWTSNTYPTNVWEKMRAAGAVFLPAAGCLEFNENSNRPYSSNNTFGYYWSSTMRNNYTTPYCLLFSSDRCNPQKTESRARGHSVRQVQPY